MKIAIVNGANINMLGKREASEYGLDSYDDLKKMIDEYCKKENIQYEMYQSNSEGEIIDYLQSLYEKVDGVVINPAGYTHYSVAILDALKILRCIKVEVHISDIEKREDYRKISITKDGCHKQIKGKGFLGYIESIEYIKRCVYEKNKN